MLLYIFILSILQTLFIFIIYFLYFFLNFSGKSENLTKIIGIYTILIQKTGDTQFDAKNW